jgi:hypothetical protein
MRRLEVLVVVVWLAREREMRESLVADFSVMRKNEKK